MIMTCFFFYVFFCCLNDWGFNPISDGGKLLKNQVSSSSDELSRFRLNAVFLPFFFYFYFLLITFYDYYFFCLHNFSVFI